MASNPELRRCPFCGVQNPHLEEIDLHVWAVVCGSCGTIGPVGNDEVQAIDRWNWRPAVAEATRRDAATPIC